MNHLLFVKKKEKKEDVMGYYCPGCDASCTGGCILTCRTGCDGGCKGGLIGVGGA